LTALKYIFFLFTALSLVLCTQNQAAVRHYTAPVNIIFIAMVKSEGSKLEGPKKRARRNVFCTYCDFYGSSQNLPKHTRRKHPGMPAKEKKTGPLDGWLQSGKSSWTVGKYTRLHLFHTSA